MIHTKEKAPLRKLVIILVCLLFQFTLSARNKMVEVSATDSRIEYTGRVVYSEDGVSYDWSGVYCRVKFTGPYLALRCSDSGNSWLNVWIDKEMQAKYDKKILVQSKDTVIVLADNLSKGEHEIIFQKCTEGETGRIKLSAFYTKGEFIQARGRKDRFIEFIGDSYTCGYGTESSCASDPFEPRTENCNLTYAAILSRYFDADYALVCHSGQGVVRNYDDSRPGYTQTDRYSQSFDMDEKSVWNPSSVSWTPDVVVIFLSTNDFSTGRQPHMEDFIRRYIELLNKVKKNYGKGIPIVCVASSCSPYVYDYIRNACLMSGLENLTYLTMSPGVYNWSSDLGASYHPNYEGQKKYASVILPYIATATGWGVKTLF